MARTSQCVRAEDAPTEEPEMKTDAKKTFYHFGNLAEYTGVLQSLHGRIAYEFIWIEGHREGELGWSYRNPETGELEIV